MADLAAGTSQEFMVACQFECNLTHSLDDAAVVTHLYRIAQTAVTNAVKHSRAERIKIGLDSAASEIIMTVTDDGASPPDDTPAGQDAGAGLRTMAYRADLIGATFNIERLGARGTRLTCVLPAVGIKNASQN
jgi:signal transduction histidine kinase